MRERARRVKRTKNNGRFLLFLLGVPCLLSSLGTYVLNVGIGVGVDVGVGVGWLIDWLV